MVPLVNEEEFTYQLYPQLMAESFTGKKSLDPKERVRFRWLCRWYMLKFKILVLWSVIYLLCRYPAIVFIQWKARQNGGLSHPGQWLRMTDIIYWVKRFKPAAACEFGSGASSALLAMLLPNRLTTVEQSEHWKRRLEETIQGLSKQMKVLRADRVVMDKDGETVCCYDMDHCRPYDFLYIDGPDTFLEGQDTSGVKDPLGYMPAIDAELFWENGVFPKIVLIDCKRATVRRLIEKSAGRYHVYLKSDFMFNTRYARSLRYRFHTVMVLKDQGK